MYSALSSSPDDFDLSSDNDKQPINNTLLVLLVLLLLFLPSVSIPEGGLKIDENKLVRAVSDRQAVV